MDLPVSTYLPQLAGSPAGTVTLHELVTHTAGYADSKLVIPCAAASGAPRSAGTSSAPMLSK